MHMAGQNHVGLVALDPLHEFSVAEITRAAPARRRIRRGRVVNPNPAAAMRGGGFLKLPADLFLDARPVPPGTDREEGIADGQTVAVMGDAEIADERDEAGEKISRWIGDVGNLGIAHDGDSLTIGDTFFTICPWWDGPRVKEQIGRQLQEAAATHRGRWIWIHHAPAANSPTSWGGARYFGDAELVQWIESHKPDMVLSGHVHQSPFIKDGSWFDRLGDTWVFNVGQQFGRPPAHIMLDLENNKAYWFSAAGEQSIDLGRPLQRPADNLAALPDWLTAVNRAAAPAAGPSPATLSSQTG